MRRLKLRFKTWLIDASLGVELWFERRLCREDRDNWRVTKKLRLFWFIEGWTTRVFSWAYDGSDEEVRDGIEGAQDNIEEKYLPPLQVEIKRRWPEWIDCEEVE